MEKLLEFIKEDRVKHISDGEFVIIPKSEELREAFEVANYISERFSGVVTGGTDLFVREYEGEDIYGPFQNITCIKVMVCDPDAERELRTLLKGELRWDVLDLPLKKGVCVCTGDVTCFASLTADFDGVSIGKEGYVNYEPELQGVMKALCLLFPDYLSTLLFCGNTYYLKGSRVLFRVDVMREEDRTIIFIEGKNYSSDMAQCKSVCGNYGQYCKDCAFGGERAVLKC